MGSRRPKSAILAVFGGLEIGLRCARYAGWVCIRCIYDLRRPPGYSLSPQKSVKRLFRGQIAGRSWFSVRHDAGVFRPNGRHQRNANGEKTLKPRSFGFWGGRTEKVEADLGGHPPAMCDDMGRCSLRVEPPHSVLARAPNQRSGTWPYAPSATSLWVKQVTAIQPEPIPPKDDQQGLRPSSQDHISCCAYDLRTTHKAI